MSFISILSKVILAFLVVLFAVYYDRISPLSLQVWKSYTTGKPPNLFTAEQLSQYNGIDNNEFYLAILGVVFDVTKGSKHYSKGASYHYFVGRDGSRSLITGNFSDTSENSDHVLDLSCDDIFALINWKNTFRQKYTHKGKLIGRYYHENGTPTPYLREVKTKIKQCKMEKTAADEHKHKYPPCNVEWSIGDGTRVWCSKNSGGVTRNWVGVPRQLYTPGEEKPQCVCIEKTNGHSEALLKEYTNCQSTSTTCIIENN